MVYHKSQEDRDVCCDFLVIRIVTKEGRALIEEATNLFRSLEKLPSMLCEPSHPISSDIQSHPISFLGKKAYMLSNEAKQLVNCRLHPLLLIPPTLLPPSPKILALIQPIQVLHTSALESYLSQIRSLQFSDEKNPHRSFKYLRRAYDNLSLAGVFFTLLFGLSGILWGMNQTLLTLLLAIGGIFTPALFLCRARSNFRQFQLCHSITIHSPTALRTIHSSLSTSSPSSIESTSHSLHTLFQNPQRRRRIPQTSHQG